ncbi:MAG: hypothetical protein Q7J14_01060, partial [Candidatus Magasanikbacteria bacterium]|nr:hypothetical protein [Candidatus Magasanikbacteria bacterium]
GRSGAYTHPLVSRWIPAGEQKDIVSEELKTGEIKCQNAFRGAVSSFVYTRFTSTSEQIDRTFTNYYRPLPKICLVGPSVSSTTSGITSSTPSVPISETPSPGLPSSTPSIPIIETSSTSETPAI